MDNLIQKFYSNGKEEEQKYTQFGAFSNSLLKNPSRNTNNTIIIKPIIGLINPSVHDLGITRDMPKTERKFHGIEQETFLKPKKLIFNGTSDLFKKSVLKNNSTNNFNNITNNINNTQNNIPSLNTIKQNMNLESKKMKKNANDGRKNEKFRIKKSTIRSN